MIRSSFRGESQPEQLAKLFGSYRAEALRDQLFELFSEPAYFRDLTTSHSCILQGGRGTGKTTVMRSLAYDGQIAGQAVSTPEQLPFIGIYYRVNPNRTAAFSGDELSTDEWSRHFAHYLNLIVVMELLRFLRWHELHSETPLRAPATLWQSVSASLGYRDSSSLDSLLSEVELGLRRYEATVNNIADSEPGIRLSMQGAPIDTLTAGLRELRPFQDKDFFILVDEYEKFEDYQQRIVNTLIKQSGEHYCFKVAVRELGLRTRETLSPNEYLVSPADYSFIDIGAELSGERFSRFAADVCNTRLARLSPGVEDIVRDVERLLPGLTTSEEARLLGVERLAGEVVDEVRTADPRLAAELADLDPLEVYFVRYWATGATNRTLVEVARECVQQDDSWRTRFDNYDYATLFTIRRGRRGIRKYYSGWATLTLLAAGNIRFILQLVDRCIVRHIQDGKPLTEPITPETQTLVAQEVGQKAITDLSGLSIYGAQVAKLQLGLGRLFGQFAADPIGHTPEVNQFSISETETLTTDEREQVEKIVRTSVMDLALRRAPATKPTDAGQTKEPEYWPHPIFSAYFVFSHRQKRKMTLSDSEILGLVREPKATINRVLLRSDRSEPLVDDSPEQLQIFEAYYSGSD